eukprot:1175598-Prorocentrum_minimum.AAC.2
MIEAYLNVLFGVQGRQQCGQVGTTLSAQHLWVATPWRGVSLLLMGRLATNAPHRLTANRRRDARRIGRGRRRRGSRFRILLHTICQKFMYARPTTGISNL